MESNTLPTAEEYFDTYAIANGYANWFNLHKRNDETPKILYEHTIEATSEYAVLFARWHRDRQLEAVVKMGIEGSYITKDEESNFRYSIESAYPFSEIK